MIFPQIEQVPQNEAMCYRDLHVTELKFSNYYFCLPQSITGVVALPTFDNYSFIVAFSEISDTAYIIKASCDFQMFFNGHRVRADQFGIATSQQELQLASAGIVTQKSLCNPGCGVGTGVGVVRSGRFLDGVGVGFLTTL